MNKKILAIAVIALAAISNLAADDTLVTQGFEGTTFPPTGWTRIIYNGGTQYYPCYWHRNTYSTDFHNGSAGAYVWWSYGLQNEWLRTPSLNLTGYDPDTHQVALRFVSAFYKTSGAGVYNYICVSRNNGSTWIDTLDELTKGYPGSGWTYVNDDPNPLEYDISDHIGNNILIGWNYRYTGTGVGRGVWSIDDVIVIARDTTTGGGGEMDLELTTITRPNTVEDGGVAFKPAVRIYNTGGDTVTATLRFRIKEGTQQVYEDALSNVPLAPGYTNVGAFKFFTPDGGKNYTAFAVVEHPEDPNPDNNDKEKDFSTMLGIDVTPFEILAPLPEQMNSFAPSAIYAENAGAETTEANLICSVEDGTFHAVVWADTLSHTFAANDTFTATFDVCDALLDGPYTITFWAENPVDASNISHPPMSLAFTYTGIAEKPEVTSFDLAVAGRTVTFSLPEASSVNLAVYDVAGNLVATLASGSYSAGSHVVTWNADASSGFYFVKLSTPERSAVRKLTLLK